MMMFFTLLFTFLLSNTPLSTLQSFAKIHYPKEKELQEQLHRSYLKSAEEYFINIIENDKMISTNPTLYYTVFEDFLLINKKMANEKFLKRVLETVKKSQAPSFNQQFFINILAKRIGKKSVKILSKYVKFEKMSFLALNIISDVIGSKIQAVDRAEEIPNLF
jgi:hypothetical protein